MSGTMGKWDTRALGDEADAVAPDGSEVRVLCQASRGGMAHFALPARQVSRAVAHRTVEEIWFFLAGRGRLWRSGGGADEIVDVGPGVSLSIPAGTRFQFRNDGDQRLEAVGVTMPPWPGTDEADAVAGPWPATV